VPDFADRRFAPFTDWSTSARHPLLLLPHRSYVISVLMRSAFSRPAEVNLGLKFVDHGGKQIIWSLNGLPNRTEGWQRWEWRLTTDPRTVQAERLAAAVASQTIPHIPTRRRIIGCISCCTDLRRPLFFAGIASIPRR
jgi:hypothetical protein